MRGSFIAIATLAVAFPGAAFADSAGTQLDGGELAPYLQCVPYARERSGVQIYGDARTWWDQAAGRYRRGDRPRAGAVMTFRPHASMALGHVATVDRVIDSRTVLLDHANWSPIDGRRGRIERGVKAIDVSPDNDWSEVRVWYAPLNDIGTTVWPVAGFIYNEPDRGAPLGGDRVLVNANYSPSVSREPSKGFTAAFAGLGEPRVAAPRPASSAARQAKAQGPRVAATTSPRSRDPIEAAIARYGS